MITSPSFFKRMLAPECLAAASQFLDNERYFLEGILDQLNRDFEFVVVGCGDSAYYELVTQKRYSYMGVDPHGADKPWIVGSTIESFVQSRNKQKNYIFLFWFNVIAHINKEQLARHLAKGDILINSTWGNSKASLDLCQRYYSSVMKGGTKLVSGDNIFHSNRSLTSLNVRSEILFTEIKEPNLFELAFL